MQGGGGIEPAGEGNADFLADGQGFENYGHALEPQNSERVNNRKSERVKK
jgi:hypothetical protein